MRELDEYIWFEIKKKDNLKQSHFVKYATDSESEAIARLKTDIKRGSVFCTILSNGKSYQVMKDDIASYNKVSASYVEARKAWFIANS